MSNRTFGKAGEDAAVEYLKKQGYRIIGLNYNTLHGELDIISLRRGVLVFTEVKTRSSFGRGAPGCRMDYEKISRLRRAATEFCRADGTGRRVPLYIGPFRYTRKYKKRRFDLLEILTHDEDVIRLTHTENVF